MKQNTQEKQKETNISEAQIKPSELIAVVDELYRKVKIGCVHFINNKMFVDSGKIPQIGYFILFPIFVDSPIFYYFGYPNSTGLRHYETISVTSHEEKLLDCEETICVFCIDYRTVYQILQNSECINKWIEDAYNKT